MMRATGPQRLPDTAPPFATSRASPACVGGVVGRAGSEVKTVFLSGQSDPVDSR